MAATSTLKAVCCPPMPRAPSCSAVPEPWLSAVIQPQGEGARLLSRLWRPRVGSMGSCRLSKKCFFSFLFFFRKLIRKREKFLVIFSLFSVFKIFYNFSWWSNCGVNMGHFRCSTGGAQLFLSLHCSCSSGVRRYCQLSTPYVRRRSKVQMHRRFPVCCAENDATM